MKKRQKKKNRTRDYCTRRQWVKYFRQMRDRGPARDYLDDLELRRLTGGARLVQNTGSVSEHARQEE